MSSEALFAATLGKLGKRVFVYRVTDSREVRGLSGSGHTKPQPADFVVTEDGDTYYAEVKSSVSKTSFPLSSIRPSQRSAATRQTRAGGKYFFFLHCLPRGAWFKVPAQVVLNAPARSLPWASLEDYRWGLAHA